MCPYTQGGTAQAGQGVCSCWQQEPGRELLLLGSSFHLWHTADFYLHYLYLIKRCLSHTHSPCSCRSLLSLCAGGSFLSAAPAPDVCLWEDSGLSQLCRGCLGPSSIPCPTQGLFLPQGWAGGAAGMALTPRGTGIRMGAHPALGIGNFGSARPSPEPGQHRGNRVLIHERVVFGF